MTVVVKKLGGDLAVVIPEAAAREMGLSEGMPLDVTARGSEIVLRKPGARRRRSMREIVSQINPAAYRQFNREFRNEL